MNPLSNLSGEMEELLGSFMSLPIKGNLIFGLTNYIFWMGVAVILLFVVLFVFKKKQAQSLVPQGAFVNGVESVVDFVKEDICKNLLDDKWQKHFPFLAALFFFILINNMVGLLPGGHPGTGTIGVTGALAVWSFIYFVYTGMKRLGAWGYIKSLAPKGVMFPINLLVWLIEVFSTFLRLVTLAVRLFCNMFAGHIVMGTFAILASLFLEPLLQGFSLVALGQAGASVFWVVILIAIYTVEILVGVIQAYVFTLLSSVYIQLVEEEE
ncbi:MULTISPECIES: F0F1 ATP synthase subunit A [Atopobium]|uniref:ATP synthase subunit a n=2 Tax=Atopobium minutum TaxID=1381 RepID=N2C011_9ACTN|nr:MULTISPECIES: F0F1 ATP synthase subunit A [Atopobium]EMZ42469.1 ATP synthase F0, A subunit [Atopobium minutum 10063974]ERL13638.1 ATP synthase F0, A subunit [Atopobium sp. BV3Ac4]KRN55808.1 ATP synthase F0, A subunit [Atopobium minutum]MBS4873546.1 F0F1 ATP synthase subunit A [Atopobium minutum]MDU4970189.1 F0F1 ATP synthase subunit A [Atopobium minutum]